MNMCFLLNPGKNLAQICLVILEKKSQKTHTLIPKNDVTEPKANSNNQLNREQVKSQFQFRNLKLTFNLLTAFNWLLE